MIINRASSIALLSCVLCMGRAVPTHASFPGRNGLIVFAMSTDGGSTGIPTWDLFVIRPDGSGLKQLTQGPERESTPRWSPDGTRIAFFRDSSVWIMNADGSDQRPITQDPTGTSWSADGREIAYGDGSFAVWIMAADGSNRRSLSPAGVYASAPAWSPDGQWIAMSFTPGSSAVSTAIYKVRLDWTSLTKLTDEPHAAMSSAPDWSPDGSRLVFASNRNSPLDEFGYYRPWGFDIYSVNADGTNEARLTFDYTDYDVNPTWSPDGSKILWERCVSQRSGLFTMNADGSEPVQIFATDGHCMAMAPSWQPLATPSEVRIDVRPLSPFNAVVLRSRSTVPVGILSSPTLDATSIDPATVCFGTPDPAERDCTARRTSHHRLDVNRDGSRDLVLYFEADETGLETRDTVACLRALSPAGERLEGCDAVHVRER